MSVTTLLNCFEDFARLCRDCSVAVKNVEHRLTAAQKAQLRRIKIYLKEALEILEMII